MQYILLCRLGRKLKFYICWVKIKVDINIESYCFLIMTYASIRKPLPIKEDIFDRLYYILMTVASIMKNNHVPADKNNIPDSAHA